MNGNGMCGQQQPSGKLIAKSAAWSVSQWSDCIHHVYQVNCHNGNATSSHTGTGKASKVNVGLYSDWLGIISKALGYEMCWQGITVSLFTHTLIHNRNKPFYSRATQHYCFWPVLISCPAEDSRLSWPGWLVKIPRCYSHLRWSPILVKWASLRRVT